MFRLQRFCVGAALGLTLLACGPVRAKQFHIQDGSFEVKSVWGYGAHNSIKTGSTPLAKTGGGFALFEGGSATTGKSTGHIFEAFYPSGTVTPPGKYTLSGYAFFGSGIGNRSLVANLWSHTPSAGGPISTKLLIARTSGNAGKYVHFTAHFTPTKPIESLTIRGRGATPSNNSGSIRLDALNMGAPAPAGAPEVDPRAGAPALALALGGLALMSERRRRKRAAEE